MSLNQTSDAPGYRTLSAEDWLAYESCLKGLLRVREPEALARNAAEAQATLHQIQQLLLHRAWRWPLQYLPLLLCRGPARSGADFLRWRNQQNNRSGRPGWQALVQDLTQPPGVREALLAIERDRIVFNMQMSVCTFILRQIRECALKMTEAENIAVSVFPAAK
ncbi:DUF3158 family protein [Citrobacter sp. S2-9]|uniref:DUF3158 family protein n=1 Tax=Citrobacter enshiensis TaxID=2971264 RepID=A0ABT8PVJ7_9ENTR|nr:DUF3158 family protein [Citrobacter enshiensis]MDN8600283.1 DUF3158 family protein [Citrobacter enshiensis]